MDTSPQARIAALEAQLAALRAEYQDFTATVSHDLRAPLRHIVSFAQLVQEEAGATLDSEVQGFLGTITDSARHLGTMLDGLLLLSRAGSAQLKLEPVDLQALVGDICAELGAVNGQRALQGQIASDLQWHIASDLPPVLADAALLRQALVCVLDNALKFSAARHPAVIAVGWRPGDRPVSGQKMQSEHEPMARHCEERSDAAVHAAPSHGSPRFARDDGGAFPCDDEGALARDDGGALPCDDESGGAVTIEIRDNGVGFNPALQGRLFQVFGRLHGAQEYPGIGVGLAVTRRIVERLGGAVRAQASVDGGCTVTLELPRA